MISSKLMGGLGNYLFQIAAGYSKSLDMDVPFIINPENINVVHKPIVHYTKNILRNIKFENIVFNSIYYEPFFHYSKIPDFVDSTLIEGYFQSEKYFKHHSIEIRNLFSPTNEIVEKLYKNYKELENYETCSIHVRRGDYLNLQDHHPVQTINYYEKSINIIGKEKYFFIFSDDIEWCKNNLGFIKNKMFSEGNEDYEDLYLMSMCNHNIIGNSSFSWWGSWLNKEKNKKIIAPKNWFGPNKFSLETKDIYSENWFII